MVVDGDVSVGAEIVVSGGSVVFGVPSDRLWFRRSSDWLSSVNSTLCSASVTSVGVGCVVVSVNFCASAEAPFVGVVGDGVVAAVGTNAVAVSGFDISFFLLLFLLLLLLPFRATTVVDVTILRSAFFFFVVVGVAVAVAVAAAVATIAGEVV